MLAFNSDTLDLDTVVLKSVLINQDNPALTVSKISYNENEIRPINFQDAIEFSPSVWITNSENQAQDNRMSIRGFGARSAFGIRGIKIVLDDIPLTTPDGQSQVDNIPFDLIQKEYYLPVIGHRVWLRESHLRQSLFLEFQKRIEHQIL